MDLNEKKESDEKIMKHLAGKELKKIIIIPDKVVSVVLEE